MNNSAFAPFGPTYLVGTSAVQVLSTNNNGSTSYRVRSLLATTQYLSWAPAGVANATPTITVTAPGALPSAYTLGITPGTVEVFGNLPPNGFFKADIAAAFEITPGEGL
jgi:hypothetical protein